MTDTALKDAAEREADQLMQSHGLRYRAVNPTDHRLTNFDPPCGMCHHFDVLCFREGLVVTLMEFARQHG